jgi:hypothetical protein
MTHARWEVMPWEGQKRGAVAVVAVAGHGGDATNRCRALSSWSQSVGTRLPFPQRYNTANFRHWESAPALLDSAGLRLFSRHECVHPEDRRRVLGQLEEMEPKRMVELA